MLAYDRIPMFLNMLMQVLCSKTYINSITLIIFEMINKALIVRLENSLFLPREIKNPSAFIKLGTGKRCK